MAVVSEYWLKLFSELTELQKRLFAGEKALEIGHGGIVKMSKITCLSRTTITKGIRELRDPDLDFQGIRKKGGGRKRVEEKQKNIKEELEKILDQNTIGDPMSTLKWTCKTTRTISSELKSKGFSISHQTVCKLLSDMDYSLQVNKKMIVFSNLDTKTEVKSNLKFKTAQCDLKKVNDKNYSASEIKMSLENYQSLVKDLDYQNKFINESKKNEIKITFSGNQVEFKTVSESE